MAKTIRTPSPQPQTSLQLPLTPPSTGGSQKKRVTFSDEAKRFVSSRESENSEDFDLDSRNDEGQGVPDTDNDLSEYIAATSDTLVSNTPLEKNDAFAALAMAIDVPSSDEPFDFMGLPLVVRRVMYGFLLTVPALICVRQNHTAYHEDKRAYLYAERREPLPGIAFALLQMTVDGYKFRFSRFRSTNICILRVNKSIHAEAKQVLYGSNKFELLNLTSETSPPANFKVPLFPRGCQRLVRKLVIRGRSLYAFQWLMNGGHAKLKDSYRGLETLTLIIEMENAKKGFGKVWSRREKEKWVVFVKRLHSALAIGFYGCEGILKSIPLWIEIKVLFDGDRYDDSLGSSNDHNNGLHNITTSEMDDEKLREQVQRRELKRGLSEAFELLKKGGR